MKKSRIRYVDLLLGLIVQWISHCYYNKCCAVFSFFNSIPFYNCSAFSPFYCHIIFPQLSSWTNKCGGFMQLCFGARLAILAMATLAHPPVGNSMFFGRVFWGCVIHHFDSVWSSSPWCFLKLYNVEMEKDMDN
jgi:hypothetical protein